MLEDDDKTTTPIGDNMKKMFEQSAGFKEAILDMLEGTERLNKVFGQTRTRAVEMMKSVSDTALGIVRLGGDINDVFKTLEGVSEATGRNVIANSKAARELYATTQVVGGTVRELVSNFADAGIQFGTITEQMEESTKYLRDMGLNTQEVMSKVVSNTSQLNKFNFEGGVQGFTRMAAKATMLRVEMRTALDFAEKVMSPEGAINVANAFQRLGVAAGNMGDPFALMNASINDPGALQDTLANISKQFTYFDEKTKSFRINPQGILTMKELANDLGMSYDELAKMGLAASELDERLSQISPTIKFAKEEDKMYLSNIAQMGKGGKYEVDLGGGITKELSSLNQEEFDRLIKEQKEAPKGMEEVARSQLGNQKLIQADVSVIKESVTRGFAKTSLVTENMEGLRKVVTSITDPISKGLVDTDVVGRNMENVLQAVRESITTMKEKGGKVDMGEIMKTLGKKFGESADDVAGIVKTLAASSYQRIVERGGKADASEIEQLARSSVSFFKEIINQYDSDGKKVTTTETGKGKTETSYESGLLGGLSPTEKVEQAKYGSQSLTSKVSQTVDFGGTVTFKVEAPPGITKQNMEEYVNSKEWKDALFTYFENKLVKNGQIKNKVIG